MPAVLRPNLTVSAPCPGCDGAIAAFENKSDSDRAPFIIVDRGHNYEGKLYIRTVYYFMKCGGCGRGGVAETHDNGRPNVAVLSGFYPVSVEKLTLPKGVPDNIKKEFQEAELCAAHKAYRGASALMRSVLEKTLKANGYNTGQLYNKIEEAFKDGIVTETRRKRMQDNIKSLGNDVVHDPWREVTPQEYDDSRTYAQRVLEDFYDHRPTIEATLKAKGRIP